MFSGQRTRVLRLYPPSPEVSDAEFVDTTPPAAANPIFSDEANRLYISKSLSSAEVGRKPAEGFFWNLDNEEIKDIANTLRSFLGDIQGNSSVVVDQPIFSHELQGVFEKFFGNIGEQNKEAMWKHIVSNNYYLEENEGKAMNIAAFLQYMGRYNQDVGFEANKQSPRESSTMFCSASAVFDSEGVDPNVLQHAIVAMAHTNLALLIRKLGEPENLGKITAETLKEIATQTSFFTKLTTLGSEDVANVLKKTLQEQEPDLGQLLIEKCLSEVLEKSIEMGYAETIRKVVIVIDDLVRDDKIGKEHLCSIILGKQLLSKSAQRGNVETVENISQCLIKHHNWSGDLSKPQEEVGLAISEAATHNQPSVLKKIKELFPDSELKLRAGNINMEIVNDLRRTNADMFSLVGITNEQKIEFYQSHLSGLLQFSQYPELEEFFTNSQNDILGKAIKGDLLDKFVGTINNIGFLYKSEEVLDCIAGNSAMMREICQRYKGFYDITGRDVEKDRKTRSVNLIVNLIDRHFKNDAEQSQNSRPSGSCVAKFARGLSCFCLEGQQDPITRLQDKIGEFYSRTQPSALLTDIYTMPSSSHQFLRESISNFQR